jgi:hypothetical protein
MVQINDMFFENLTPENTIALLDNLKDGRPVKIGCVVTDRAQKRWMGGHPDIGPTEP